MNTSNILSDASKFTQDLAAKLDAAGIKWEWYHFENEFYIVVDPIEASTNIEQTFTGYEGDDDHD